MRQVQRRAVRGAAAVVGMVLATALSGCSNFFVCDKASCTSNPSTPTGPAGDVAYVGNNVSASTSINGYTLTGTTLTGTTKSPYAIGNTPTAMVLSHANGFLYEASAAGTSGLAGIFGFTVGTGGALTVLNSGTDFVAQTSVAAMDVSPDGQWLIATTGYGTALSTGATIQAYQLNATTGAVTAVASLPPLPYGSTAAGTSTPVVSALKVAPSGQFISVALGTGGVITFPFNTTSGLIGTGSVTPFTPAGTAGAYDVAIDGNNLMYVAATGVIFVFQVSSLGVPSITPVTSGTAIGATGPWSIALDGTSYVYAGATGSAGTNMIYAFSNKAGALTALTPASSATIAAPSGTTKIAVDSTGAYLLADGYDSTAGLKLYSITSATGVLTSLDTAPTGGTPIVVPTTLALSH
jgi:6-phosphogluconolactonase